MGDGGGRELGSVNEQTSAAYWVPTPESMILFGPALRESVTVSTVLTFHDPVDGELTVTAAPPLAENAIGRLLPVPLSYLTLMV